MKKLLLVLSVVTVLAIILLQIKNYISAGSETKELCLENRFNLLNKEMDLHLQLLGQKIMFTDNSNKEKILFVQLNNTAYDFRKDFQSAMEYYIKKKEDSLFLADIKLIFLGGSDAVSIVNTIHDKFKNNISIVIDTSSYYLNQFSALPGGAIIALLNKENVCQYAYYLEQNNDRKILENSPVMFNLIKNLK